MATDTDKTCYALHVPDGVLIRRIYTGGPYHSWQVGVPLRFWGDALIPGVLLRVFQNVATIWHDVKTADGNLLAPTQVLFAPHFGTLTAWMFLPVSLWTGGAEGPLTMTALVPLAPVAHCQIREVLIPDWARQAQLPPPATFKGDTIPGNKPKGWPCEPQP